MVSLEHKAGKQVTCKIHMVLGLYSYAGKPSTTYINASMITFNGLKQQFVATMAPKPNTVQNFWQMIIEKKVRMIVMLTSLEEGTKKKADQYWPDKDQETVDLGNGVKLQHVTTSFQGTYLNRQVYALP